MTLTPQMGGPLQQEALEQSLEAASQGYAALAIENEDLKAKIASARNDTLLEISALLRARAEEFREQMSRTAVPGAGMTLVAQSNCLSLVAVEVANLVVEPAIQNDEIEIGL